MSTKIKELRLMLENISEVDEYRAILECVTEHIDCPSFIKEMILPTLEKWNGRKQQEASE